MHNEDLLTDGVQGYCEGTTSRKMQNVETSIPKNFEILMHNEDLLTDGVYKNQL